MHRKDAIGRGPERPHGIERRRLLALGAGALAALSQSLPKTGAAAGPYRRVATVEFDAASHRRRAPGSDNWPMTWADDDRQYTAWGDGGGFGGTNRRGRCSLGVARVSGDSPGEAFENLNGGADPRSGRTTWDGNRQRSGKSYGIVSLDDGSSTAPLYMWVNHRQFDRATLWKSNDRGLSWTPLPVAIDLRDNAFHAPSFISMGKAQAAATDDYVYAVSSGGRRGGRIWVSDVDLLRVPRGAIEDIARYQTFTGFDSAGRPTWSNDLTRHRPILRETRPRHGIAPWVSVGYSPAIGSFFLFNASLRNDTRDKKHRQTLSIHQAPAPWGPWRRVGDWPDFLGLRDTFFYTLAPKWISADGTGFTLVFTGTGRNDSWNTVRGRFVLGA